MMVMTSTGRTMMNKFGLPATFSPARAWKELAHFAPQFSNCFDDYCEGEDSEQVWKEFWKSPLHDSYTFKATCIMFMLAMVGELE